jgi:hypothetical protein
MIYSFYGKTRVRCCENLNLQYYLEDRIIVELCQEKKINSTSSGVELEPPYLHSADLRESKNSNRHYSFHVLKHLIFTSLTN